MARYFRDTESIFSSLQRKETGQTGNPILTLLPQTAPRKRKTSRTMTTLDTEALLRAIDEELDRLRKVRNLLAGEDAENGSPSPLPLIGKRNLSAEARQRIVDAQKRRWAAQKGKS